MEKSWEQFVEEVLEQLHRLHRAGEKADLLIFLNRTDHPFRKEIRVYD